MQRIPHWIRFVALALVVLGAPASVQAQGRLSAAFPASNSSHAVDVNGASTASIAIAGTFTGTVTFYLVPDIGDAVGVDCATPLAPGTAVNSATAPGMWICPAAGADRIEARMTAYTDGTALVAIRRASAPGQTVAGAGGGSFDGVLLDAAGGDALTDTVNNALRVNIVAGAGSGGTAIADDAAFTAATTSVTPAGGFFDDVAPDSVNEGDAGAIRMSANRNLYSTIRDAAGNERGLNVAADGSIAVTVATVPSHAVTNAGTFVVQENGGALTALQLIDNAVSGAGFNITQLGGAAIPMQTTQADNLALTTDALLVASINYCYSGTDLDLCPTSTGGSGVIDANTNRVTIATDDPVNDMAVLFAANLVASDAADAGSPLKIGFRAESSVSGRTAVADNDRVDAVAGLDGVIIMRPHANLEDRVSGAIGITDGASTQIVAAQGAGIRYCATSITISNSSATNVTVDVRDGTAGSVLWTFPAAANMGGATHQFQTPLCTTANTIFAADPSAAATTVTISTNGFKTVL